MPDNESKAEGRARRARQFQEIEDSLARATDLIDQSKREVARSQQIMKDSEAADDKADQDREDAGRPATTPRPS
jgi:hypothetical protein